jgi:hypothetical protein
MMLAIQDIQARKQPDRMGQKPVKVLLPVNLRKLFPSRTLRNFVLYSIPEMDPRLGDYSFPELCRLVHYHMGAEVTAKNLELQQLSEQMAAEQQAHRAEVESLSSDKAALDRSLHTIYYIVGQEKKLREAQIISKEGLIGRTLVVAKQNSLDFFMQADSRELLEVAINQKKAEIVTSHPEGSYELIKGADKTILKLVITDPTRFWESSKMLIVSYR